MISEKIHGKYILFTKDGKKILGKHSTLAGAKAQETAINLSKARAAGDKVPPPTKR